MITFFLRLSKQALLTAVLATAALHVTADTPQPKPDAPQSVAEPTLEIYKSPTCGCCKDWVTHVEKAGFTTRVHDSQDLNALKEQYHIAPRHQSCHTAISEDNKYFFEGHIPAKLIQRFLREKPEGALGLAVPGMPLGSPGMEMGERFQPYQVLQINSDGSAQVYASVTSPMEQY